MWRRPQVNLDGHRLPLLLPSDRPSALLSVRSWNTALTYVCRSFTHAYLAVPEPKPDPKLDERSLQAERPPRRSSSRCTLYFRRLSSELSSLSSLSTIARSACLPALLQDYPRSCDAIHVQIGPVPFSSATLLRTYVRRPFTHMGHYCVFPLWRCMCNHTGVSSSGYSYTSKAPPACAKVNCI